MFEFEIGDVVRLRIGKNETTYGTIQGMSFDEDEATLNVFIGGEKKYISVNVDDVIEKISPEAQKQIDFLKEMIRVITQKDVI